MPAGRRTGRRQAKRRRAQPDAHAQARPRRGVKRSGADGGGGMPAATGPHNDPADGRTARRERWWDTEAGVARVRRATAGADQTAWRAGRRRRVVRLCDIEFEVDTDRLVSGRRRQHSCSDDSKVSIVTTKGSEELERQDVARQMEWLIAEARGGQGWYAVGSRWHDSTLRGMLKQLKSPSLQWRFGDG